MSVETDVDLINYYDQVVARMEKHILSRAKGCHAKSLAVLRSVSGIGKTLALTIGNPYLKWAFSEAAVYSTRFSEGIGAYLAKLERKYGR